MISAHASIMTMNPSDRDTEALEQGIEPTSIESVVRSLRSLLEGDQKEQRETFEYLKRALDEDHPSSRRLFQ